MGLRRYLNSMLNDPVRGLQISILMIVLLIIFGAFGYMIIERMTPIDAFYMTIITVTTVGFGEVTPLSVPGRAFTSLLILTGIVTATNALGNMASILLGQHLWQSLRERRMNTELEALRDHYIICGFGRMGDQVVRELGERGRAFVVVDKNSDIHHQFLESNVLHVIGDATDDNVLIDAGIERAAGLVASLDNDPDNMMAVLTARGLNPGLHIVTRATSPEAESKLQRAGADHVISPWQTGGHRMTMALLKPFVHEFMDLLLEPGFQLGWELGQIPIEQDSQLAGHSVAEAGLYQTSAVTVLGVRHVDGEITLIPSPERVLRSGETIICIGPPESIRRVESVADLQPVIRRSRAVR